MLKFNALWAFLVVPLLSILTIFVLPLRMYWSTTLRAKYWYDRVDKLANATNVLVTGKLGNVEIARLQNLTLKVKELDSSRQDDFLVTISPDFTGSNLDVPIPFHSLPLQLPEGLLRTSCA